jgi:RNA polymerase sigma factor (sigma-70 family)
MSTVTDAQLVAAYLAGDRSALAGIYDRYGAVLYDTAAAMTNDRHDAADIVQDVIVVAAERLGQLRDQTRLKPWLFAILRNEVYRRTGRKRRTIATDFTEPVAEMALPTDDPEPSAGAEFEELASLVRAAAGGLDERDQLVLELSLRQGLDGTDLADALGVTPQQSYNLLHRMRQRTERSLAAYCVARRGRKDCAELAEILRGWDEQFTVLIRKRVARHIDACEICERARRALAPLALFAGAPAFAAPVGLRERVLAATANVSPSSATALGGAAGGTAAYGFGRPGGFPSALRHARRLALIVVAGIAALLLAMGTTVYVLADADDDAAIATVTPTSSPSADGGELRSTDAAEDTGDADDESDETDETDDDDGDDGDGDGDGDEAISSSDSSDDSGALAPGSTTPASTDSTSSTTTIGSSTTTTVPAGDITSTTLASGAPVAVTTTLPAPAPPIVTTTVAPPPATTTTTTSPPPPPPPPAVLSLSSSSIDFGTSSTSASVTLSNTGGSAANWSASSGPLTMRGVGSPFALAPSSGTLQAGQSVVVGITFDRAWPVEGLRRQRVTFVGGGTSASIDLRGTIARPPVVRVSSPAAAATHCPIDLSTGRPSPLSIDVSVSDESMPPSGVFTATRQGATVAVTLTERSGVLIGTSTLDNSGDGMPDIGLWTWQITVSDALGNTTRVQGTVDVQTFHCR